MGPNNQPAFNIPSLAFGTVTVPGDLDSRFFTSAAAADSGLALAMPGFKYTLVVSGANVSVLPQAANAASVTSAGANDLPLLDGSAMTFTARRDKTDRISILPAAGTFKAWLWCSG